MAADFATEAGHWYAKDGSAVYTVTGKNGRERATTLRDAREHGYLPSVTSILKLEAKPQLTNWLIQQAAMACITLPRLQGEDDDQFIKRALQDSQEQAKKARERGTYLHGLLEQSIAGTLRDISSADDRIIGPCMLWLHTNFNGYAWAPERSFASDAGFGGKVDLVGTCADEAVVIDFKVKADIIEGKKLTYDEHPTQLAAYAYGLGRPRARCLNLFISSTVPGLIVPVEHTQADIDRGWEAFSCLLQLWKVRRGL